MLARCLPRQPYRRRPAPRTSNGGFVQATVLAWTQTGTRPAWLSDELLRILERRNGRLVGLIYLAHFDSPIGDTTNPRGYARHYTGWTLNLPIRLGEHAAGRGARLMQVVAEQGIAFKVTRLWIGTRSRERSLKRQGGAARRCPVCRLAAAGAAVPASDQGVLDALELGDRTAVLLTSPPPPGPHLRRPVCRWRPPHDPAQQPARRPADGPRKEKSSIETRLAERYVSVLDFVSRCAQAVDEGNWHYLWDKAGQLARAAEQLDQVAGENWTQVRDGGTRPRKDAVAAAVAHWGRHYRAGRLLHPEAGP